MDGVPNIRMHARRARERVEGRCEAMRSSVADDITRIGNRERLVRRVTLSVVVFVSVFALHFLWLGFFPERAAAGVAPGRAAECADEGCCENDSIAGGNANLWLKRYTAGQNYWLGYSYASSLTFAALALQRYRERRLCTARNLALGGVTLSGVLAVLGCYLLGCCGSPMLPIYLSLFGAAFLPLAKPLVAALTTLSLLAAWWWLRRQERRAAQANLAATTACCASVGACCRAGDNDASVTPEKPISE